MLRRRWTADDTASTSPRGPPQPKLGVGVCVVREARGFLVYLQADLVVSVERRWNACCGEDECR